jgi:hypothetical protein
MSNDMNALTEKVGEVSRATTTALSNAGVTMDASNQVLQRQRHVTQMAEMLRTRQREGATTVDIHEMAHELEVLSTRCPGATTFEHYLNEQLRLNGIVASETAELYEMVEKMRDLAGATVG